MYDAIIVGAGPAGLMAGWIFKKNKLNYLIIEKGKPFQDRNVNESEDVSCGFGGAGLFSDGKLSYAPAASWLWRELLPVELKTAYENVTEVFLKSGVLLDEWDDQWIKQVKTSNKNSKNYKKIYKSDYLNKKNRNRMMRLFEEYVGNEVRFGAEVMRVNSEETGYVVETEKEKYHTKNVIFATGKVSIWDILGDGISKNGYLEAEMGVRVQIPKQDCYIENDETIDYKYIEDIDENTELRTFCYCEDGVVRKSQYNQYISYNGDGSEKTGISNIGVLLRAKGNSEFFQVMKQCYDELDCYSHNVKMLDYCRKQYIIGKKVDDKIKSVFPQLFQESEEALVWGPEIEKYGYYPYLNSYLQLQAGMYFAGDSCNVFRGLMASFVSGAYVANMIIKLREESIERWKIEHNVKQSSTKEMKTVFTAQSKNNFFCKNAICEFVFKEGKLPLNPFRVFGYFLDDRVERDLIRRGNNQLIKMCDELWVFGLISDGVLFEIISAIEQKKQIRFFTCDSKAENIREMNVNDISFEPEVHAKQIKKQDILSFILNNGNVIDSNEEITSVYQLYLFEEE